MNGKKFHNLPAEERKSILRRMIIAGTNHEGMSNREFAEKNSTFRLQCEAAGVQRTKRQASKYRRKLGKAFNQ